MLAGRIRRDLKKKNVNPVLVYESSFSCLMDEREDTFIIDYLMHP